MLIKSGIGKGVRKEIKMSVGAQTEGIKTYPGFDCL
jgi:hypothetical protein